MDTSVKRLLVRVITGFGILAGFAIAQAPERKQIMASGGSWVNPYLSALRIERGANYPSVIHLQGQVEIKMKGIKILADEAQFHEGSGEIEVQGNVRVLPYPAVDAVPRQQ